MRFYDVEAVLHIQAESEDHAQGLAEDVLDRGIDQFGYGIASAWDYDIQRVEGVHEE